MIAQHIMISDEMLDGCQIIKARITRILWYSVWRRMRIQANELKARLLGELNKYELLKELGKPVFKDKRRKSKPDYSEEEYEGL